MLGATLSHFRILESLGTGGLGESYLAENLADGSRVVMRILTRGVLSDGDWKRLMRDVRAAATIEHPHVAATLEIGSEGDRTFIVREYVPGRNLRQARADGHVDARRAMDIVLEVLEGLAHAHEQGILHLDLKPENVIVSDQQGAKLTDFGLSPPAHPPPPPSQTTTGRERATPTAVVAPTIDYLPPERARREPGDGRSDIYAIGCLLRELWSGSVPGLKTVIDKATAQDPGLRYQEAAGLAADLRGL